MTHSSKAGPIAWCWWQPWLLLCAILGCGHSPGPAPDAKPQAAPLRLGVFGRRHQVGFEAEVELIARVYEGESKHWTYQWTPIWGPPPKITEYDGGSGIRFRTVSPPSGQLASEYLGRVLPLSAAQAGRVVFRVQATSDGTTLQTTAEVIPAYPTASWPRLAVGVDEYWPIVAEQPPWGSSSGALQFRESSVPYLSTVRAGVTGWYDLTHPNSSPVRLRGGVWLGSQDCGRFDCHPVEYQGWKQTAHSSIFDRGLRGELPRQPRGSYQEHCAACHTLGNQPGADNDGFDDRVRQTKWQFPQQPSVSAWSDLPQAVKDRANVQCEHCHSAGWFFVGYGNDICAQCHDHPPEYLAPAQLRANRMVQSYRSVQDADPAAVCKDCHTAKHWLRSMLGHESNSKANVELDTRTQGVTCPTCHTPHGLGCRKQLRVCGPIEIPGLTYEAGQGTLCVSCHIGESDIFRGPLIRPFIPGTGKGMGMGHGRGGAGASLEVDLTVAPHAPQFQMLTGRGGRFLTLPDRALAALVYPHMWVPDTCVGCHFMREGADARTGGHTFRLAPQRPQDAIQQCPPAPDFSRIKDSTTTSSCAPCHGDLAHVNRPSLADYDGDGKVEGAIDEIEGLMSLLRAELLQHIRSAGLKDKQGRPAEAFAEVGERIVATDSSCTPLQDKQGKPMALDTGDPLLQKGAFNYLLVWKDGSGGIHNFKYCVRLLQNTIESLEKSRKQTTRRHAWARY
jgi:hypothetical protein